MAVPGEQWQVLEEQDLVVWAMVVEGALWVRQT